MNDTPRRIVILTAASRIIRHYGPFKSTVADIAREARVGVGTVYLEFRSKDAILEALSGSHHARVLGAIERAWGTGRPAKRRLVAALRARVTAFLDTSSEGAHGADLFACACPAIDTARARFCEAEHTLFARFLREGATRGELLVRDPSDKAHALLLAYRAFQPPQLFDYPADALERDLARVHRLVFEGLLPRGRGR